MALKDIFENFEEYEEINKFRTFLFTPANILIREIETINPVLTLRKTGFHTLDFRLPAKIFDLKDLSLNFNDSVDFTLDGYEVEVWIGGDTRDDNLYEKYRFIISNKPSSMSDDKPEFSYSALSSEFELKKVPIINWPGVEVEEYKQTSKIYQSQKQTNTPLNSSPILTSSTTNGDIELIKTPVVNTVKVSRVHVIYGVPVTLFPSLSGDENINESEYYLYEEDNKYYVKAYVPANIKLPTGEGDSVIFNDPIDQYQYFIFYETEDEVLNSEITSSFEEAYYFSPDGLTINQIVEDLFENLQSIDSNMRHFLGWTYDAENSDEIEAIRSGITFSTTNVYDMLLSLQENYQIYIDYDTIKRTVTIKKSEFGVNNGLRFEYGKYIKGITQNFNTDEQINYVQGKDANGIGFADLSWSGDNYLENYTYQLDGVVADEVDGVLEFTGLPSRWLSNNLAKELATRKYYQDKFREEVWGNKTADPEIKGIAKIRFDLQEKIANEEFELEKINIEIKRIDGLIESYQNEETSDGTGTSVRTKLDRTARNTAYIIPNPEIDNTRLFPIFKPPAREGSGITVLSPAKISQTDSANSFGFIHTVELDETRKIKTFVINGMPIKDNFRLNNVVTPIADHIRSRITVLFIKITPPSTFEEIVATKTLTLKELNKILILEDAYDVDRIKIFANFTLIKNIGFTFPITFRNITVFAYDPNVILRSWDNFVERQEYLKLILNIKKSEKELEIALIKDGIDFDPNTEEILFNPEVPIDEEKTYGILQLERRLDYIRTFTSINYEGTVFKDNLGVPTKESTELKRIRKGFVYENNDILDSKNLFQAAEEYLEENINPLITVNIESISLLQSYEAKSDWSKVKIGERVDILVEDIKVNIEAEIVEISIDMQNYSTSLTISTLQNYDKTFSKYFADIYNLLNKTVKDKIIPGTRKRRVASDFIEDNRANIRKNINGSPILIGYDTEGVSNDTESSPDFLESSEVFINPLTETLSTTPPEYLVGEEIVKIYGNIAPGSVRMTNGGIYIKDEDDNLIIKMTSRDGLVAENFRIDLDGNASFSGDITAATGTFGAVSVNREFAVYEASVLPEDSPSGYIISNIVYTGEEQLEGLFLEEGDSKSLDATTSSQITSETFGASEITNEWMVRLGYTGVALIVSGSHNDDENAPEGFNVGEVYFFEEDQLYYEVIGVQGSADTTIHYLSLTIPQAEGTKTYTLVLNFDLDLYQLPPRKITHEWNDSTFISFEISSPYRTGGHYTSKTIVFTETLKSSLTDILGLALASSGLGSVVTSINGQSGDVELELQSAVTSVNGQVGEVTLDVSRKGNKTFLQEPEEEDLIEGDIWFDQGDE